MSDEYLLNLLAEHHLTCPVCGYDLYRLTEPRCPECGRSLALVASPTVPVRRAWIALLAACAVIAGVGLLLLVVSSALGSLRRLWRSGDAGQVVAYAAMLMIPLPVLVLRLRRPFVQAPAWQQRILVGIAILVACIVLGTAVACIG